MLQISTNRCSPNSTHSYSKSPSSSSQRSSRSPCPELDTTDDSALDASFTSDHEPDLIIIDFEYCAYNYRGFDLANHFIEWTFDYTNPQFPYFYHNKKQYSTTQQRRDFIVNYLKKYHDDEHYEPTVEELDQVDEEIRLFTMLSHLFWSLWSVVNVTSAIEFGYWVSWNLRWNVFSILHFINVSNCFRNMALPASWSISSWRRPIWPNEYVQYIDHERSIRENVSSWIINHCIT